MTWRWSVRPAVKTLPWWPKTVRFLECYCDSVNYDFFAFSLQKVLQSEQPLEFEMLLEVCTLSFKAHSRVGVQTTRGFRFFRAYLQTEFSEENLLCWKAIRSWNKRPSHAQYSNIFVKFVAPNSPLQVNLPSWLVDRAQALMTKYQTGDADAPAAVEEHRKLMKELGDELILLMKHHSFHRSVPLHCNCSCVVVLSRFQESRFWVNYQSGVPLLSCSWWRSPARLARQSAEPCCSP